MAATIGISRCQVAVSSSHRAARLFMCRVSHGIGSADLEGKAGAIIACQAARSSAGTTIRSGEKVNAATAIEARILLVTGRLARRRLRVRPGTAAGLLRGADQDAPSF